MNETGQPQKEQTRINRQSKATVFEDLFSDPKHLLELYRVLHPEDTTATEDDLRYITLKNVLTRSQYNDLGFMVGDRMMILVEAQSTWSVNIIPRCMMYLAETWNRYFVEECCDVYSTSPVKIPEPELYVLYTGEQNIKKDVISLSEEFFDGKKVAVDASVKVLKYSGGTDIVDQYIRFCKILDEQRALYPQDGGKAIRETIEICKNANILREYLDVRREEVIHIMILLYDQEQATKMMLANVRKQERAEGREQGRTEGKAEMAKSLFELGIHIEDIAKSAGCSVETVKQWLNGLPA